MYIRIVNPAFLSAILFRAIKIANHFVLVFKDIKNVACKPILHYILNDCVH